MVRGGERKGGRERGGEKLGLGVERWCGMEEVCFEGVFGGGGNCWRGVLVRGEEREGVGEWVN